MTTEVYPYQNIGENIPLKKGKSFTELTNALARQLSSFITGTERVQADFSADNALGPVIDSIAKLVDVTRRSGQSDKTLSGIVLDEVSTREQTTINALTTAIENIIGVEPVIGEYPDVDFVNDHGLSRNEGAILVSIVMPDQEQLKDLQRQTDVYKAAGIAVIYDILTELIFTEEMTMLEELFSIIFTFYHEESMTTLSDNLDGFEIGLTEALTSITDALRHEGEMFFSEALTTFDDELSHEGVLYFSEDLATLDDYFGGGAIESFMAESMDTPTDVLIYELVSYFTDALTSITDAFSLELGELHFTDTLSTIIDVLSGGLIESFHTEALTAISEELDIERMFAFIEALTTISDYLSHEAEMYFSEDLTTLTDVFGGGAIDAIPFTESLPRQLAARIGIDKIGLCIIGVPEPVLTTEGWNVSEWDVGEWDDSDAVLVIHEVF